MREKRNKEAFKKAIIDKSEHVVRLRMDLEEAKEVRARAEARKKQTESQLCEENIQQSI